MVQKIRSREALLRYCTETPTPEQLHGLTGDLIQATRFYSNGIRRRRDERMNELYCNLALPPYMTIANDDNKNITHEIVNTITAKLSIEGHKQWGLAMVDRVSEKEIKQASIADDLMRYGFAAEDSTDDQSGTLGIIGGESDLPTEWGCYRKFEFHWNHQKVSSATQSFRVVPESDAANFDYDVDSELVAATSQLNYETVSAADVIDLRRRIGEYCGNLVSVWGDTRND